MSCCFAPALPSFQGLDDDTDKPAAAPGSGYLGQDECRHETSAFANTEVCRVASGDAPIEGGAEYDFEGVIKMLLKAGHPVLPELNNFTPVWMAVVMKLPWAITELLKGVDCKYLKHYLEHTTPESSLLPLAAEPHPMKDVCRELILGQREGRVSRSGGHNIMRRDTPNMRKHWLCTREEVGGAINSRNAETVAALISGIAQCGIKIDLDFSGGGNYEPALASAARYGNSQTTELLLSLGARTMAKNLRGQTSLHVAAAAGHSMVVLALLHAAHRRSDLGALIHAKDMYGRSAAEYAQAGPCKCLLTSPILSASIEDLWGICADVDGDDGDDDKDDLDTPREEVGVDSFKGKRKRGVSEHDAKQASSSPPPFVVGPNGWRRYEGPPPFSKVGNVEATRVSVASGQIVEVVGAISPEVFVKDFLTTAQPAIFRGAAANMEALKEWTPSYLSSVNGSVGPATVEASILPYGKMDGVETQTMQLRDYIEAEMSGTKRAFLPSDDAAAPPPYVFESLDEFGYLQHLELEGGKHEFADVPMLRHSTPLKTQFILGPPGSGSQ